MSDPTPAASKPTNASVAKPAAISPTAPRQPIAPKAPRQMKPPGQAYQHSGTPDLTADAIAAVNANATMPAEVKAFIAAIMAKRGHKITKADIHVFDNDGDWTITAHVKKVA